MNLVKIAELLKNAPDQTLMQEMQHPSGSAPSYMILSELERRKKLRGSLMNNEPQSSVAEDMEREALQANQMGIGSMGMNPMERAGETPQGYAGGGEVQHYAGGEMVWGNKRYAETDDPTMVIDPATGRPISRSLVEQSMKSPWNTVGAPAGVAQSYKPSTQAFLNDPNMFMQPAPMTATLNKVPEAPANTKANTKANTGGPNPSSAPIPIPKDAEPKAASFVDQLLKNADLDRTEMRNAHKSYQDMLAAQTEEVKKSKNSDIALALMQAGLGIAGGRSQYAMENIGQGAQPALQAYIGMDRDRRKQLNQLAMAQGQAGIAGLKDIQGINKDLATIEYQGKHGEYFGKAGDAALMNARTNAAQVGSGIKQAALANSQDRVAAQNYQYQLNNANEALKDIQLSPEERKYWVGVRKNAVMGLQKLTPMGVAADEPASGVNTTSLYIADMNGRMVKNPNYKP